MTDMTAYPNASDPHTHTPRLLNFAMNVRLRFGVVLLPNAVFWGRMRRGRMCRVCACVRSRREDCKCTTVPDKERSGADTSGVLRWSLG